MRYEETFMENKCTCVRHCFVSLKRHKIQILEVKVPPSLSKEFSSILFAQQWPFFFFLMQNLLLLPATTLKPSAWRLSHPSDTVRGALTCQDKDREPGAVSSTVLSHPMKAQLDWDPRTNLFALCHVLQGQGNKVQLEHVKVTSAWTSGPRFSHQNIITRWSLLLTCYSQTTYCFSVVAYW